MYAIFKYEYRCGTNASETALEIDSVFGEASTTIKAQPKTKHTTKEVHGYYLVEQPRFN